MVMMAKGEKCMLYLGYCFLAGRHCELQDSFPQGNRSSPQWPISEENEPLEYSVPLVNGSLVTDNASASAERG